MAVITNLTSGTHEWLNLKIKKELRSTSNALKASFISIKVNIHVSTIRKRQHKNDVLGRFQSENHSWSKITQSPASPPNHQKEEKPSRYLRHLRKLYVDWQDTHDLKHFGETAKHKHRKCLKGTNTSLQLCVKVRKNGLCVYQFPAMDWRPV